MVLVTAFQKPQFGSKWFRTASCGLSQIARRRRLSVALVGLLALAISAGVSLLVRIPAPRVNDEFSYLLAADTFAHGRLSNPTHPLWVHFESLHIIHQPTYASKYPPAQGLMLAAGQLIGGHPIIGVWISTALACAAICWMLQAWLPPRWAVLGGLLAVSHVGILLKWGQSYWGGAMTVIGGALVFGALRRVMRRPQMLDALLMAVGLAILANSRPFEGLVVSLPVAATLLAWMTGKHGPAVRVSIGRIVLPSLLVFTLTAGAMGYYNLRVTGDALRMPYLVHEATYGMAPLFLWQHPRPEPIYRHNQIREYYTDETLSYYKRACSIQQCSIKRLVREIAYRIERVWTFYLGFVLTVPLVMLPWVLRNQWQRFALLIFAVFMAAYLQTLWAQARYMAPLTGLVFAFVLQAMRHLRLWQWRGRPVGRFMVRTIPLIYVTSFMLALVQMVPTNPAHAWSLQRAQILWQLNENGGHHLIIVRYGPEYTADWWVYNEADIDGAKVVWAREMDAPQNRKLLEYFKDRRVWLLEVDTAEPKLVPYPAGSSS